MLSVDSPQASRSRPSRRRIRTAAADLEQVGGELHRLLGATGSGRFRYDARNPLPHDLVIVDETSMVSLPLMARLLGAVRPDATLVLVGDPFQLASVEAGLDYDISGSLLFHTSSDDVADCMWKKGHYVTQGPMVP